MKRSRERQALRLEFLIIAGPYSRHSTRVNFTIPRILPTLTRKSGWGSWMVATRPVVRMWFVDSLRVDSATLPQTSVKFPFE